MRAINKNGSPYMGGNSPDLSDLNVYGVLTAIEGCDAFKDLTSNTPINKWFKKMKDNVQNKMGSDLLQSRGKIL